MSHCNGPRHSRRSMKILVAAEPDKLPRLVGVNPRTDERKRSAMAFLKTSSAYYASLGIKVERVTPGNGSGDRSCAIRNVS